MAQDLHVLGSIDADNLRIAARDEQTQVGELGHRGIRRLLDEMRQHMAMQVVHVDQRDAQRQGKPLAERCAHMQRPGQPWATRESNGVNVLAIDTSLTDGLTDHRHNVLLVGA